MKQLFEIIDFLNFVLARDKLHCQLVNLEHIFDLGQHFQRNHFEFEQSQQHLLFLLKQVILSQILLALMIMCQQMCWLPAYFETFLLEIEDLTFLILIKFIYFIEFIQNYKVIYNNKTSMVDVNEPISRAFCIGLRFLQFGVNILIAQFISKISNTDCSQTLVTIGLPISYIIVGINIIAIFIIRCRQIFNRKVFFVYYAINIILAGVVMIVGFGGIGQSNSCANNQVLHRYAGFQSLVVIVISVMALFGEFDWALRYTNAPGNLTWPFLFLGFAWTSYFKGSYITVGIFTLFISLVTFVVNLLPLRGGLTTGKRKIIHYQWIGALILMAICQIIVFATYLGGANANQFNDFVAKKLAQTYLPINLIDGILWVWGIATLSYTTGDHVRDNIMKQDPNQDQNDLDLPHNKGIGTLR